MRSRANTDPKAIGTSRRAVLGLGVLVTGYLGVIVTAGAPRSPLVPRFPEGVGQPSWTVAAADRLGLHRLERGGLTVLSLVLLAALLGAFAVVLREAWSGRVTLGAVLVAGGLSLAIAVAGPLLLSRDVYSYAVYGRIFAVYGENPYVLTPQAFRSDPFTPAVSASWLDTISLYGPAFTLLSAMIARAWAGSPDTVVLAFRLLAGGAIALTTVLVASACRRTSPAFASFAPFAAAAVALNPVVILHTVGGGHNDALIAAGVAGALVLALRAARGPTLAGSAALGATAVLTVAALVKIVAAVPLVIWGWSLIRRAPRADRARVAAIHGGTAAIISLVLFAPFFAGWRTLTPLVTLSSLQGWASGPALVARGARGLADIAGGEGLSVAAGLLVNAAFLAIFAAVLLRILRDARPETSAQAWGTALLILALSAPYLIPWYAVWFLPLVAFIRDRALVAVALAAAAVLALTGVPAEPAGSPGLWRAMLLAVHYGAAPIMLALALVAYRRVALAGGEALERDPAPLQRRGAPRP